MREGLDLRLYVILDAEALRGRRLDAVAAAAIAGGATVLQVRHKSSSTAELLRSVREVMAIARPKAVPVIVNDRLDVALAASADGVHLGEDDMPVADARRILGEHACIGASAGSPAAAVAAEAAGADYLGVGDVYGTRTKPDADTPIGLDGLRAVVAACRLPVVAIGGLAPGNAAAAVEAGAVGVAVISAIVGAADVAEASRRMRSEVDAAAGTTQAARAVGAGPRKESL